MGGVERFRRQEEWEERTGGVKFNKEIIFKFLKILQISS